MGTRNMLSVGIDVGTTTTQLVLSDLAITNQHRLGLVPRLDIDTREVRYQGDAHFTPLLAADEVDVDKLTALIRHEYTLAGVDPGEVETGAVIITGETARTRNAEQILHGLGDLAGDFVVTVAGPNLKSQIAGRGSGAAQWSAANYASVVNVDVGGGSSNAALFRSGKHIASAASMVGGRQAVLEKGTGRLLHLAPTGRIIADQLGLGLRVGEIPRLVDLKRLAAAMADIVVDLCLGVETPLGAQAALSPRLDVDGRVSAYFVSGGVGQLYYAHAPASTLAEVSVFGDIGPLLAEALRENPRWAELRVEKPAQTLRATVLGAASQQVTLSGSTIWAENDHLPLRNAPVIEPRLLERDPGLTSADAVAAALGEAVERWDRGAGKEGDFAISLPLPGRIDFAQLTALADGVVAFARRHLPRDRPLVLVIEQDYAQVLGQTVKQKAPELALIVVDQIQLGEGDFIDIGEPLFDGRVVPVSVKTLVFYQATENKTRPGS